MEKKNILRMARRLLFVFLLFYAQDTRQFQAWGQQPPYPTKPIQFISSQAAGGQSDIVHRLVAEYLKKKLGVPVVVVNLTGGGGVEAATTTAKATPDGYTMGSSGESTLMLGLLQPTPTQPSDFRVIANYYAINNTLFVNAESPWKTMKEFVQYAKTHPRLKVGNSGRSSASWWRTLVLNKEAGIDLVTVPFRSDAEITTAVLGKHVDCGVGGYTGPKEQEKAGKVRLLMTFNPDGIEGEPSLPTLGQVVGRDIRIWPPIAPIRVPAKTPDYIVKILSAAVKEMTTDPAFKAKMTEIGAIVKYMDEEELNAYLKYLTDTFKKLLELEKK